MPHARKRRGDGCCPPASRAVWFGRQFCSAGGPRSPFPPAWGPPPRPGAVTCTAQSRAVRVLLSPAPQEGHAMQVPVSCSRGRRGPLSRHPNEEAGVRGAVSSCLSAIAPSLTLFECKRNSRCSSAPVLLNDSRGKTVLSWYHLPKSKTRPKLPL